MARKITDKERLDWIIDGNKVWKSRNKGYYAGPRAATAYLGAVYGIDGRKAIDSAIREERKR